MIKFKLMIQRIQSIFLFLAVLGFTSLFKFPFAKSNMMASPYFEDQNFLIADHNVLMGLVVLGGITCLVNIFLYNNRLLQLRIGYISLIASFFLILVAVWLIYSNANQWSEQLTIDDGLGIYTTIITLVCIIAANYYINKDEKTVRSMDRLR